MAQIKPTDIPLPKLHEHLLHAVAPRPIAFVSTVDLEGNVNLSPFSFFNCFGSNPPTLVYSPALSGRTGATKNTHDNVKHVPECVVNIGHYDILYQMNLAAGMYPKGVNEFAKAGLTAIPSVTVKPPRVAECYVQFECEVKQVIETGTGGGAGNLVICEVKLIHIDDKVLKEDGSIDPFKMDYIARMGKHFWCRVGAENMFEMPGFKMHDEVGLGFDKLPTGIVKSKYLRGNDIAQIATMHTYPTEEEIWETAQSAEIKQLSAQNEDALIEKNFHLHARAQIEQGLVEQAFRTLMAFERLKNK